MDAIMNYYPKMKNKLDIYCSAEVMIIKKNDYSLKVIKEWLELCENKYINRNRSIQYNELPFFKGNDCDNGLFNMCISKHEKIVEKILHDEKNIYIGKTQLVHFINYAKNINNIDLESFKTISFSLS